MKFFHYRKSGTARFLYIGKLFIYHGKNGTSVVFGDNRLVITTEFNQHKGG